MSRPQPAQHGSRAQQARMVHLISRDSERRRACAARDTDASLALETAACMSHHGRAPKETGLSPVQSTYLRHGPTTTSAARRARNSQLECCTSSQETASAGAQARLRLVTRGACLALEPAAGTSHHERAPNESYLLSAQWPSLWHRQTAISAARRAY